eukprot:jgi/Psemu1/3243/gm1.3243_g
MVAYLHHQRRVVIPKLHRTKYISQDDDVPEEASETAVRTNKVPAVPPQVLGTVCDGFSDTAPKLNAEVGNPKANTGQREPPPTYVKATLSLSEEDLDYQNHQRSVEKNLGSALNGQTYADTEFKLSTPSMVGAKSLVVKDIELAPKDQRHMQAQPQNGNSNKSEQNVQLLNYCLDVTMPKFPLKVGWAFASHGIEVILKDPDPEILYSIYQIGQAVMISTSVNEKGSKYDPDDDSNTEFQEDEQY